MLTDLLPFFWFVWCFFFVNVSLIVHPVSGHTQCKKHKNKLIYSHHQEIH